MSEYIKVIHNVETGEIIEREMTPDEIEAFEADRQSDANG